MGILTPQDELNIVHSRAQLALDTINAKTKRLNEECAAYLPSSLRPFIQNAKYIDEYYVRADITVPELRTFQVWFGRNNGNVTQLLYYVAEGTQTYSADDALALALAAEQRHNTPEYGHLLDVMARDSDFAKVVNDLLALYDLCMQE